MNIGSKIKGARVALDMTQEELARKVGVSKNAISNYENGVSTPKIEILYSLMLALGVDANYIYDVAPDKKAMRVSDHERKVLLAYRSQPSMQISVDRLLQIEEDPAQTKDA